jgi:GT2 family glycosyltransferase
LPSGPLVTVAIPTLAAGPPLEACLAALNCQTFRDFEVVIIDNGCHRSTLKAATFFFACRQELPVSNLGFGGAVNLAIRTSSSPLIAVLNDDTEPGPEWLASVVRELQAFPRAGMCASKILLFQTGLFDSAGMLICLDGSSKQRGGGRPETSFPEPEDVLCPSGCAALYRREMLDETGLFDEDFFLYCEDTDLGLRARRLDWSCRYAAGALVRHHYSRTAGAASALKAYSVERNRLWVALKNFPLILLPAVPFVTLFRYFWLLAAIWAGEGAASEFIGSGNGWLGAIRIVSKAYWDTWINLPSLLRKRARIRKTARLSAVEFIRILWRYRIGAREVARA